MFKKFDFKEDTSSASQIKSSAQRAIRQKIQATYKLSPEDVDTILPKKSQLLIIKGKDSIQFIQSDNKILFYNSFDGPWMPTLTLVHKYPNMLPIVQVERVP